VRFFCFLIFCIVSVISPFFGSSESDDSSLLLTHMTLSQGTVSSYKFIFSVLKTLNYHGCFTNSNIIIFILVVEQ